MFESRRLIIRSFKLPYHDISRDSCDSCHWHVSDVFSWEGYQSKRRLSQLIAPRTSTDQSIDGDENSVATTTPENAKTEQKLFNKYANVQTMPNPSQNDPKLHANHSKTIARKWFENDPKHSELTPNWPELAKKTTLRNNYFVQ